LIDLDKFVQFVSKIGIESYLIPSDLYLYFVFVDDEVQLPLVDAQGHATTVAAMG